MKSARFRIERVVTAFLLLLASAMPVGVVAFMVVGQSATTQVELVPQAIGHSDGAGTRSAIAGFDGLLVGTLYSQGRVTVNWNGETTPVENGRYAYVGGEVLRTGPADMGVLHLGKKGRVSICPNSSVSLAREAAGYHLSVHAGVVRFAFAHRTMFDLSAGGVSIAPQDVIDTDHVGEVRACSTTDCWVMALRGGLRLSEGRQGPSQPVDSGHVARVTLGGGAPLVVSGFSIPPDVLSEAVHEQESGEEALKSAKYLCRIEEVATYSELSALPPTAAGAQSPDGDRVAIETPEVTPPVEPPLVPPLLALARPPDPEAFDPEALPPPAAGPAALPLTVPAPVVPTVGTGGGGVATRS